MDSVASLAGATSPCRAPLLATQLLRAITVCRYDGIRVYVLALNDPGVANWLDTAGWRDDLAILRWQQVPATMTNDGLIRDFRVIKLADLAALTGLPRVSPDERRKRIAARTPDYNTRVG